jgi:hypothetical protein
VSILAVALLALPQLASAQLPLETKSLRIQATAGTDAVTLTASTVTTPYSINFPGAVGGLGSFLFANNATGGLAWTNTPSALNNSIFFNSSTGLVEWVDPNSANNPNWSRTGNLAGGILGTTAIGQGIDFVTEAAANIRMSIAPTGTIGINNTATGGATTTIGRAAGHTTVVDGAFDVNGATTIDGATIGITGITTVTGATTIVGATDINATGGANTTVGTSALGTVIVQGATLTTSGSLGHTGASSFTGAVTLAGATSPLVANSGPGTTGDVLVSAGAGNTPSWQSLNDAIGIRAAGNVSVAVAANSTAIINVPNLLATDAILITLQGSGSTVVATVTNRVDAAAGSFVATFSGAYVGVVNYLVIKTL